MLAGMIHAPAPRRGGTRLYCPMVDVPATEESGELVMCGWRCSSQNASSRKAYRRHWWRDHMRPFLAETEAVMRYVCKSTWDDVEMDADITVSRDAPDA